MARTNKRTTTGEDERNQRTTGRTVQNNATFDNFADILAKMTGDGSNSDIEGLLNGLGISSDGNVSGAARMDWNKQLLDTLLQYYMTQENRGYNESLPDEQRIYDNPMNQLARLMGAGISRDKAIELLSSGGSGGSGSGVPYSDPAGVAEGIAPTQSNLNHTQAQMAKLQTGLGFVSAVTGLVSLGFSAAQAIPQIKVLQNSAYLSKAQKIAFDDSSTAFRIISSAGVKITDKTFGSVQAVQDTIKSLADGGNTAAAQFMRSGGMYRLRDNSPYTLPFLNQMYKNENEPNYYSRQIESALRQQSAQTHLAQCNADQALAEIEEINAKIENLYADTDYKQGLEMLLAWQAELMSSQTEEHLESANQIRLSNTVEGAFLNSSYNGSTGLSLFTDARLQSIYKDLQQISTEIGSKTWESQVQTFLMNQDNLQSIYALQTLYNQGELDAVSDSGPLYRNFLYLSRAAKDCGVFDYVNAKVNARSTVKLPFGVQFDVNNTPIEMRSHQFNTLRGAILP